MSLCHYIMTHIQSGMTYDHAVMIALMTYDEFQRHVGKAGLTIKAFAELMGMNRVSVSNLAKKGEVPTHLAVIAALLGEMADKGIDFREVLSRIDISPKKPRGAGRHGQFGGSKQGNMFYGLRVTSHSPPSGKP